ncbi:Hypothetical predicted protein [Olea europaea subsp. europaea]|uniref:Uncharacterized protein n=1 Tax=Olea europaea subsp. europaea TaxID=158383 RepID=A0A8S0VML5_OLEEU|nr:Hypothetical predicted protein [Olea europaea subsp. europaea]
MLFLLNGVYQLPHMLPSEEAFADAVSALGIENKDGLVVYDGKGIFSAARVWCASSDAIFKASAASEATEKSIPRTTCWASYLRNQILAAFGLDT